MPIFFLKTRPSLLRSLTWKLKIREAMRIQWQQPSDTEYAINPPQFNPVVFVLFFCIFVCILFVTLKH